jgi:hypothetical protein
VPGVPRVCILSVIGPVRMSTIIRSKSMPASNQPLDPESRLIARRNARELAEILKSKVLSHRRICIGEPRCPYRVPFHNEDFWFTVLVSETDFVFTGEHRRRGAFTVPFCVSLKQPHRSVGATIHLSSVSTKLGLPVYAIDASKESAVSARLLAPEVRGSIRKLDLAPIRSILLNAVQIHAVSELVTPQHCAEQAEMLRGLLVAVYRETYGLGRSDTTRQMHRTRR